MVEKYRSIEDIRDLTSEQVQQIATMQSIQASLLEYYYQFQIAVESQSKLNEIAYTVAITVITTALTMGIGSAAGWVKQGIISSLITEPLEEVFIDPVLEAVVSRFVEILGGDEYAQMIASTLAESGREGAFGISSSVQQQQQIQNYRASHDTSGMSRLKIIKAMNQERSQQQAQESSTISKVAKVALMTLSIFGMLIGIGGIFGGLGGLGITSLSAFLIDNGGGFIDFFRDQQEQLGIDQDPLQGASQVAVSGLPQIPSYNIKLSHISNYIKNMKGVFEVSDTQKSRPSDQMIDKTLDLLAITAKPKYQVDPITGTLKIIRTGMSMVKDNDPNKFGEWIHSPKEAKKISNARPSNSRTKSYRELAEMSVVFKDLPRKQISSLTNFLKKYTSKYNNYYATNFRLISDFLFGRITNLADFIRKRDTIIRDDSNYFIVYKVTNKETGYVRIGYWMGDPASRMRAYLKRSFAPNPPRTLTNFHKDMRGIGDPNKIPKTFDFQVLYIFKTKTEAKVLEQFLTIYENQAENELGYDLSINNYYNPIIGDLTDSISGALRGELNPSYISVDHKELTKAIKGGLLEKEIRIVVGIKNTQTLSRKLLSYGFSIKNTGTILDARAFFVKPVIEEAAKKDLSTEEFFKLCKKKGIEIFEKSNPNEKSKENRLNYMCKYIWSSEFKRLGIEAAPTYSRVRKYIIAIEANKLMKDPRFNLVGKIREELKSQGFIFRYDQELTVYLKYIFDSNHKLLQNEILYPILSTYLRQDNPELSIEEVTVKLGLDPTKENKKIVFGMIYRVFGQAGSDYTSGNKKKSIQQIRIFLRNGQL